MFINNNGFPSNTMSFLNNWNSLKQINMFVKWESRLKEKEESLFQDQLKRQLQNRDTVEINHNYNFTYNESKTVVKTIESPQQSKEISKSKESRVEKDEVNRPGNRYGQYAEFHDEREKGRSIDFKA